MDEIAIAPEEITEFDSPACIQAIHSLDPDFKPYWRGHQLHKYYEERELTFEQMRAMVLDQQAKGLKYLQDHAEEAKEFLEKGYAPPCPDVRTMLSMMDKVFPETQPCPVDKLLVRLEKKTGSKFKATWILRQDEKNTGIYLSTIEHLWKAAIRFNHDADESLDLVEKLVLKKLGINRRWWQFWR